MLSILGPVLAQIATLSLSDRSEIRAVHSGGDYAEANTSPRIGLNVGWKKTGFSLGYGPSFTVTPLTGEDRNLVIFHAGAVGGYYEWQRARLTFSESVGYGELSFRQQALGGNGTIPGTGLPAPTAPNTPTQPSGPGGMAPTQPSPGTSVPTVNQVRAYDQVIRFATSSTNVGLSYTISPVLMFGAGVGYFVSGSVGKDSGVDYPLVRGPTGQAQLSYRFTPADDLTATVFTQYASASNGNNSWFVIAGESWGHAFDARTNARVGSGLSISRNSQASGFIFWSIYPTFSAMISRVIPEGRGAFAFGSSVATSPAIDPVRALVDPRLSWNGFAGWGRDRFSSSLTAGSAVSFAQQSNTGTFNSLFAALGFAYRLGKVVSVDTGVRGFWQSLKGQSTTPPSYAVFLGVTIGGAVPLTAQH